MPPHHTIGRTPLEWMLDLRAPTPDMAVSSLYLRPGPDGERFLEQSGPPGLAWRKRLSRLGDAVLESDTGIVGLRAGAQALVVLPPFPVLQFQLTPTWDTGPLRALLAADYTVGVVLLRLGRYSVAVYRGEGLLSSKTDSRLVHARHHKGGSSSARFQRRRQEQAHHLYTAACQVVREQFGPYARQMDYVLLGGERLTLLGFRKVCDYLAQFQGRILDRRLNVRDPKHDALEAVAGMLRESRVYHLEW
ncbi:MAG: hypothetical protein FJ316_04225 [SAR202 cluster bacterium]|nr:hypothetical protein [SAR202 cluster bacterium]